MKGLPMGSTKYYNMNRPMRKYTAVHVTKGTIEVEAKSAFSATTKAAKVWNLVLTGGIDVYLMDQEVVL